MPFKGNAIIAAVIQTASSGRRVVIGITDALAATIQWFTGDPSEQAPALMAAIKLPFPDRWLSYWGGIIHTARPTIQSTIRHITTAAAVRIEVEAERITLQNLGGADPSVYLGPYDIAGPWTAYTPNILSTGTQPTLGASTLQGRYWRCGKTCVASFTLVTAAGWLPGTGSYSFSLPFAAVTPVLVYRQGAGFLVNQGGVNIYPITCYTDSSGRCQGVGWVANPGFHVGSPEVGALTGAIVALTITYEIA